MKTAIFAAAVAVLVPFAANATVYSLSGDFSNGSNPNGVWSFTQGAVDLAHYAEPTDGNSLSPAAANGYYGVGPTFGVAPILIKVTQDGSATAPYSDNDFLAGDVIAHSTNPGAGGPMLINWTAPSSGQISFSSSLWYAHSPVSRSDDISDILGGAILGTVTVDNSITRSKALTSLSGVDLAVTAGEMLTFRFDPTAGQTFGSLSGISETVDFTPAAGGVPEPSTWALMLIGAGCMGVSLRRRRTLNCE